MQKDSHMANNAVHDMKIIALFSDYMLAEFDCGSRVLFYFRVSNLNETVENITEMISNKHLGLDRVVCNCPDKKTKLAMQKINNTFGKDIVFMYNWQ